MAEPGVGEPRLQLRDYRIAPGHLDDFLAAWSTGVRPLRAKFGFDVQAAWVVPGEDRFVWLMAYRGPGSFVEADAAYYASPERRALEPDPAQWIVENRTTFLVPAPGDD